MAQEKVVITLSRQAGAGGACIGRQVARRLGLRYLDREILSQAARCLSQDEEILQSREQRVCGIWENLLQVFSLGTPEAAYPLPEALRMVTDRELFEVESELIRNVAAEGDAVVVGRAGFRVLKDHPRAVHIFLHADVRRRAETARRLYRMQRIEEGVALIEELDSQRDKYIRTMTGATWQEADNFHLCIDTGRIPTAVTVDHIVNLTQSLARR